jgi:GT2 family glycosyltransferase/spore maturation protein CgeB
MQFISKSLTRLKLRGSFDTVIAEADAARDSGDWANAARLYGKAVRLEEGKSWAWVQYAHALKESGSATAAVDAYERAMALSPDDIDPLLHLCHLLKRLGHPAAIERFGHLRDLTGDMSINDEISRLTAFHGRVNAKPESHSAATLKAAKDKVAVPVSVVPRAALPTSLEPGLHARSRGVRFVALDRSGRRRHKLRLSVDGRKVWSGWNSAKPDQVDGVSRFDAILSFSEPSVPTDVRRVRVEAATIGLEPSAGVIELPYASRFSGRFRIVERGSASCIVVASFVDCEGLTTKPFIRVVASDETNVEIGLLQATVRGLDDGSVQLECRAKVFCSSDAVAELAVYPMWSTAALSRHASIDDKEDQRRLVGESDFQATDVAPNVRLERVRRGSVSGWAILPTSPDAKLVVDILHGETVLGSGIAARQRSDLATAFGTTGAHAYEIEIAPALPEGIELQARVRSPNGAANTAFSQTLPPAHGLLQHRANWEGLLSGLVEPPPLSDDGFQPSVAAVVLNRNGANLLRELFSSIAKFNTYQKLEILVIDHESTDHSEAVCQNFSRNLNVKFLKRGFNASFSNSNNFGASQVDADLVFFLNNDTCFVEDVIPQLVCHFKRMEVGAVGLRLVDRWSDYLDDLAAPPIDQHLGVFFRDTSGRPSMYELRAAPSAESVKRSVIRTPAVTAAALLMRRSDFLDIGGFDERYFYGQEDVDLCLRLGAAGKAILSDNRVAIAHLRGFTRLHEARVDVHFARSQARNRELINRSHARSVHRQFRANLLDRSQLTASPVQIALIVTSLDPETLAGDVFTAQELAKSLADLLPKCEIRLVAPDANRNIDVSGFDIIICMRDDFDARKYSNLSPACHVVYWIRNNFDRFLKSENWQFADDIWISSERERTRFEEQTGLNAKLLRIATNAEHFSAATPDAVYACDYCFTGTRWALHREISVNLVPSAIGGTFRIFGAGWDKDPIFAPYAFGSLRYSEMARVYASTRIVIDDANHVTVESGSVNSRVFDAIAAGALPLTNGLIGAEEVFGGALPTYSSGQELQDALSTYLEDEGARLAKVHELRSIVERDHTYARRATDVEAFLRQAERRRPSVAIKIAAPKHDKREEWGDFHFAEALRHSLARLGVRSGIFLLNEWDNAAANACDVSLVLRGLSRAKLHAHQVNLLWVISHPDKVSLDEYREYDHVFAASDTLLGELKSRDVASSLALQCTDTRRFRPGGVPIADAPDVLFVGNSRGVMRPIVSDAIAAGLDLHVYGEGWTGLIPSNYVKGTHIPNDELPRWYASAGVVLNDHWPSMIEADLVSNRVFDILAAGGSCISDANAGLERAFGSAVETYSDAPDLRRRVEQILQTRRNNRDAELELANQIERDHSFDRRATLISDVINDLMSASQLTH